MEPKSAEKLGLNPKNLGPNNERFARGPSQVQKVSLRRPTRIADSANKTIRR